MAQLFYIVDQDYTKLFNGPLDYCETYIECMEGNLTIIEHNDYVKLMDEKDNNNE
jgi:hypothetical protein